MPSTLRDPAPPAATKREAPRAVLADRLRRLGPRERVVLTLAVVALTLIPAIVTAVRPATLHSEVRLAPAAGERTRPGLMARYVERFVHQPLIQDRIAGER